MTIQLHAHPDVWMVAPVLLHNNAAVQKSGKGFTVNEVTKSTLLHVVMVS